MSRNPVARAGLLPIALLLTLWDGSACSVSRFWERPEEVAEFTNPPPGQSRIEPSITFQWTEVPAAEAYYLYVGTSPGAKDVLDSGEIRALSFNASFAGGGTVYASIWTRKDGRWRSSAVRTLNVAEARARFNYPVDGDWNVAPGRSFEWKPVERPAVYRLTIGREPGGTSLFDSGDTAETSIGIPELPAGETLFARLYTKIGDETRYAGVRFRMAGAVFVPPKILFPPQDARDVDLDRPIEWSPTGLAQAFRLQIGTSPGGGQLDDSGEISVSFRIVEGLPTGVPLYGTLATKIKGEWIRLEFRFSLKSNEVSWPTKLETAMRAAALTRSWADSDNKPFDQTPLFPRVLGRSLAKTAYCDDYSSLLLKLLEEVDGGLQARILNVRFNLNGYDRHTLVEVFDPERGRWVCLDPTFALAVRRRWDSQWASAEDIQNAVWNRRWDSIEFVALGKWGLELAQAYYLDYPLLFLIVERDDAVLPKGESPLDYLAPVAGREAAGRSVYAVRDRQGRSVRVMIDGRQETISCDGLDGLSRLFFARTLRCEDCQIYRPRRFVFDQARRWTGLGPPRSGRAPAP